MKAKTLPLIAALLAAGAAAAVHAQTVLPGTADPMSVSDPQVKRDVVRAEAAQALKLGLFKGDEYVPVTPEQQRQLDIAGLQARAQATHARFDPATVPLVQQPTASRAKVSAEAREAMKLGLIDAEDREPGALPTPEQQYRIERAGVKADDAARGVKADDAARGVPFDAAQVARPRQPAHVTCAQVEAEAIEARTLGLLDHGDANAPDPTPQQQALLDQARRDPTSVALVGQR